MTLSIAEKIHRLRLKIARFEQKYDRVDRSVQLIAVSKTRPAEIIKQACTCGQRDFGENQLQEAMLKISSLESLDICWHFIGPVQSNKTRAIAENFDWVHSVDRVKIARRLSNQRPSSLPALNILLQVNLSREKAKSGVNIEELDTIIEQIKDFPGIILRGLMAIPPPGMSFEKQRATFRLLAQARQGLLQQGLANCEHLSMGMSQDFEAAIAEGATMVRIGTDIFGPRTT